jgi:hypothetical protein
MRLESTQTDGERKNQEPKNRPTFTDIYYTVPSFSSAHAVTFSRRLDASKGRSYHAGGWDKSEQAFHRKPRPQKRQAWLAWLIWNRIDCGWTGTEVYELHVRKCGISLVPVR